MQQGTPDPTGSMHGGQLVGLEWDHRGGERLTLESPRQGQPLQMHGGCCVQGELGPLLDMDTCTLLFQVCCGGGTGKVRPVLRERSVQPRQAPSQAAGSR